jgi:hypothetical protein
MQATGICYSDIRVYKGEKKRRVGVIPDHASNFCARMPVPGGGTHEKWHYGFDAGSVAAGAGVGGTIGFLRLTEEEGWERWGCNAAGNLVTALQDECRRAPSQQEMLGLSNGGSFDPNQGACIAAASLRIDLS